MKLNMRPNTFLLILLTLLCLQGCFNRKASSNSQTAPAAVRDTIADNSNPAEASADTTNTKVTDNLGESEIPSKPVNCFFRYDKKVEGYTVTGTFTPYDSESETGQIELRFDNGQNSFNWKSNPDEVYTSSSICDICFSQTFNGWKNDSTYTFHYYSPEKEEGYDELHPLGYRTPFQFLDIDFDGKKEFLISDWSRERGGNSYKVYRIKDGKTRLIHCIPYTEIQTGTLIDPKNKSIEINIADGSENSVKFVFARNVSGLSDIDFPEFPGSCGKNIYDEFSRTWKSSGFVLKEFEAQMNKETKKYILEGGKFIKSN